MTGNLNDKRYYGNVSEFRKKLNGEKSVRRAQLEII